MRTAISSPVVESSWALPRRAHRTAHIRSANCLTWSVKLNVEELLPGSQLIVRRRGYWHHGIYAGNGRVIQYAGWFHSAQGLTEEVLLEQFSEGRTVVTRKVSVDGKCADEIVRRARSRLGERSYDLLRNNCEHLCNWFFSGMPGASSSRRLRRSRSSFWSAVQKLRTYLGRREPARAFEPASA